MTRDDQQKEELVQQMKDFTENLERILSDEGNQVIVDDSIPFYIDDEDGDLEPATSWEEDSDQYIDPDVFLSCTLLSVITGY
jgi:cytochrome oxidase Cu insertion factor (SCO1/SenC/PrrC family)